MNDVTYSRTRRSPLISVIMANYGASAYLPAALQSVLAQTVSDIELIVSDDASPDDSVAVVRQFATYDPRVRLIEASENRGPAAARNQALQVARGEWIAIVDSDDIVRPARFATLLAAAGDLKADAIADDLHFFSETGAGATLLGAWAGDEPLRISAELFVQTNTSGAGLPPLGYLKPLFRRSRIAGMRYDETIRIAEDYDFLLRLLLEGARFFVLPRALYLYRRHASSISHRLSEAHVLAMIDNQRRLVADRGERLSPAVSAALERRLSSLYRALAFERLVAAMKGLQTRRALGMLASDPRLLAPLAKSASEHWRSRRRRSARIMGAVDAR